MFVFKKRNTWIAFNEFCTEALMDIPNLETDLEEYSSFY